MCPSCGARLGDTVDVLGTARPQGTSPEFQVFVRNVIRQLDGFGSHIGGLKKQLIELLDHR